MSTLPSSGPISMSQLRSVLGPGGSGPISMSEYKQSSSTNYSKYIPGATDTNLSISTFYGKKRVVSTTYNTPRWGALTKTAIRNSVGFNWTAPSDCTIQSIQFYTGHYNNGSNITISTSSGITFISGFWSFELYNLITFTSNGVTHGSRTWPAGTSVVTSLNTPITAGTILYIYDSSLSSNNSLYYGKDSTTGGMGFSITYLG